MANISMKQLLEAGVHFGHQTKRWNPKMKKYIFTARNDIYIIDLQKTVKKFDEAFNFMRTASSNGASFIFVGTKKQAQDSMREAAEKSGMYFVNHRWLGGMLTNFNTIGQRIKRLKELEKMSQDGTFEVLPKKEVAKLTHEMVKLENTLGGIKTMKKIPEVMFVVDPKREHNAIKEARKLGMTIVGLVDTNCDPDEVDYIIPANDDAIRAVKLLSNRLAEAIIEGKQANEEKKEVAKEATKTETK